MWLAFYNANVGDVLMATRASIADDFAQAESNAGVTVVKDQRDGQVVAVNVFDVQEQLGLENQGQVKLNDDQTAYINQRIQKAGFDLELAFDNEEKFVVGYVEACEDHPDSDHLSITQTRVSPDQVVQIVCGASNIDQGLKVLVAKPGAVMPSGAIIWPGELRGEESMGMICSTRELGLEQIEDYPGIWELESHFEVGTPLSEVVADYQA
ncbi:YtpR family tRNA-binding protein [Hutsoniella sourekii]